MTEENIDYQLGASVVDQSAIGDGEFVPFKMESSVVFRRLAEDIYPSPKVGIREAITNAITATKKVKKDNFEPVINIKIDNVKRDRPYLIIEDNGVGMTMETIRQVVSYIGRSTVRDDNDKTGQFGMGFLALFSLCGSDGGFVMHTNSRNENSEPISGVWKDGGFSRFENNSNTSKNIKGTRFEIILREDISAEDIRTWVEDVAKWSRVPILYEDKTEDGVYSDEFGVSKLESLIMHSSPFVVVENEYYKAICSDRLDNTPTILLDVLIDRGDVDIPHLPFDNIAIRLKKEHPVAMTGKYKDKMVIRKSEYHQLSKERKSLYVIEDKVDESVPITPSPTGTREKLNENNKFWRHVGKQVKQEYENKCEQILDSFKNDMTNIQINEYKFLEHCLFTKLDGFKRFDLYMEAKYKNIYSKKLVKNIYSILQSVNTYRYDESNNMIPIHKDKKVYEIINADYDYVFMFINNFDDEKAIKIHASNSSYIFVKIENANWYSFYEDTLGWEKLKNVKDSHPVCKNVTSNEVESLQKSKKDKEKLNKNKNEVVIYFGNTKKKFDITKLPAKIKNINNKYVLELKQYDIEKLILFTKESKYNISEYTWLRCDKYALVNVKNKDIEMELKSMPLSITISEFMNDVECIELQTSDGKKQCKDIPFEKSVLHVMDESMYSTISNIKSCEKMQILFNESAFSSVKSPSKEIYIPVTKSMLYEVLPFIKKAVVVKSRLPIVPVENVVDGPNYAQCKLYLNEFENRNTDIIQEIDEKIFYNKSLTGVRKSILYLLDEINDSNIDLKEVSNYE